MPPDKQAQASRQPRFGPLAGRSARGLVPFIYAFSLFAFIADLFRDNTLAYGLIYAPMVSTAVFFRARWAVWVLAATACAMVAVGAFFPVTDTDLPDVIGNRVLSILAIIATALFMNFSRATQERLAMQTKRAEAAEHIKSEVLANMSDEMRSPLHALLSVLSLMMVDCRADQREALGGVRGGAQQLLASIDNLIDLTRLDEHRFERQRLDAQAIACDAVERAQFVARERQVTITPQPTEARCVTALGDAWAVRRIVDNLLANAIAAAPAGSTVSVSVGRESDTVTISVSDTGHGLPPDFARYLAGDADSPADGKLPAIGTGLTLSVRLARAVQGRLAPVDQPGGGTILRLSLPAAEPEAA